MTQCPPNVRIFSWIICNFMGKFSLEVTVCHLKFNPTKISFLYELLESLRR